MIFFRRRKNRAADSAPAGADDHDAEQPGAQPVGGDLSDGRGDDKAPDSDPGRGPWDVADQPELGKRVDVGALRVPARPGMQMRMELEPKSRRIVAVNVLYQGSAAQLQAFAAPRSSGIWEELREEITQSIGQQGGSVEEREGTYGTELLARLPVRTKDGRSGLRPVRFLGVDGQRWFLRAVISGKAAVEEGSAAEIEDILADVVVVRGDAPRPPRELLPLHLPGKPGEVSAPARPTLNLDEERGPEITEVG